VVAPGQALVGEGRIERHELSIAVGRQIDAREALVVQREWEGQRDGGNGVVTVIADVGGAWHNRSSDLRYGDLAR
jgi:hypothetical protein